MLTKVIQNIHQTFLFTINLLLLSIIFILRFGRSNKFKYEKLENEFKDVDISKKIFLITGANSGIFHFINYRHR
jgi:hypothetical protein